MDSATFNDLVQHSWIQKWLNGHRLAIAANLCLELTEPIPAAEKYLIEYFSKITHGDRDTKLLTLPLFTLHQLHKLANTDGPNRIDEVSKHQEHLKKVINRLTKLQKSEQEKFCFVNLQQQFNKLVFHTNWGGEQIGRFFRSQVDRIVSVDAKDWYDKDADFERELTLIRSPWGVGISTYDRMLAIVKLIEHFTVRSDRWKARIFAFSLFDTLFSWPLLIVTEDGQGSAAVSIPIAIDFQINNERRGLSFNITGEGSKPLLDIEGWRNSFPAIFANAHQSFRASRVHRKHPFDNLSWEIDLCLAEMILRPLVHQVRLLDRSMEAYFTSVCLSRMLGSNTLPRTLITGHVGPGLAETAELGWPGGVVQKTDFVFTSTIADRFVVSQSAPSGFIEFLANASNRQTASVYFVETLRTSLNIAIGPLASAHRYIRCQELTTLDPSNSLRNDLFQAKGDSLLRAIDTSNCFFLDVEDRVDISDSTPEDIHHALLKIEKERQRSISWTFVKVYENEDEHEVLELIGEALGASEADIDTLLRAGATSSLVESLTKIFEKYDVLCLPEYLVLIGGSEIASKHRSSKDKTIYDHSLYVALTKFVEVASLRTRIILCPDSRSTSAIDDLTSEIEPSWLDLLRVFRGSFDQNCAALVLGKNNFESYGLGLREGLNISVSNGWLMRCQNGDFLVRSNRGKPSSKLEPKIWARIHFRAMQSFAPMMASNQQRTGLSLDESTAIANVLEASHHIARAVYWDERWSPLTPTEQAECRFRKQDQIFIRRFLYRRSIGLLRCPILLGAFPELLLRWIEEDQERLNRNQLSLHPFTLALDPKIALNILKTVKTNRLEEVFSRLLDLYINALHACDSQQFQSGSDELFCGTVARIDSLLVRIEKEEKRPMSFLYGRVDRLLSSIKISIKLEELNAQAVHLILCDRGKGFVPGEWYQRRAAEETNSFAAAEILSRSVLDTPEWSYAWPLFFGAVQQAYSETSDEKLKIRISSIEIDALKKLLFVEEWLFNKICGNTVDGKFFRTVNNPFAALKGASLSERHSIGMGYMESHACSKSKIKHRLSFLQKAERGDFHPSVH